MHSAPRRTGTAVRLLSAGLVALAPAWAPLPASAAAAQEQPSPPAAPEQQQLPPRVVLGLRAETVRRQLRVRPSVVIVSDTSDYARLIARWSFLERFPVLIDDSSDRAREDIARFVRAFEPASVLRWSSASEARDDANPPQGGEVATGPLPEDPVERRAVFDQCAWRAWGATSDQELRGVWEQTHFTPPGVILASPFDPAWTAALALAAGRGEPIIWTESRPQSPGRVIDPAEFKSLDERLGTALDALALPGGWRDLGDGIDAVTLCLNLPARLATPEGEMALTDRIGRHADLSRFAWCGMIFGDEPAAAYRAMCALFLQPHAAWLFDGYKAAFAKPYEMAGAAEYLSKAGFRVSTNVPPLGGIEHWRQRALFGTSADLICVNSSGLAPWFDLSPGRGYAGDVPLLARPAIVHFIHSFSAQVADEPSTIAGRWIENGAYAYCGSMAEPTLGGFLPTQIVVGRMLQGAPFSAAVRFDSTKLWKINVFGDPLTSLGEAAPRLEEPLTLAGAAPIEGAMRSALAEHRLADAAADLIITGRDEDAARIAKAALDADPTAMTTRLARVALWAAYRRRHPELFLRLYGALSPRDQREPLIVDALWQTARTMLATTKDARLVGWLRSVIRNHSILEDAETLAPALGRASGPQAVRELFASLAQGAQDEPTKNRLREAGKRY